MNYQLVIDNIHRAVRQGPNDGDVAAYIPELGRIDPEKLGVYLINTGDEHFHAGDWNEKFSIQSIAKVLSLTMAYKIKGKEIWKRVGTEPSGTAFNSLVQLEYEKGIPRNPMINAGAIVVCDILVSELNDPLTELLQFIRTISNNQLIAYDKAIMESEKATGYRNSAVINLMKTYGSIDNDLDEVLNLYYNLCSIKMTCREVCETFMFLANQGVNMYSGKPVLTPGETKRVNAIMQTCGFYDEAGEFAYRVGLPGKSGVGGGIVAVHPTRYCIVVWSPRLNQKGNSYRGMKFLEEFTTVTEQSIF